MIDSDEAQLTNSFSVMHHEDFSLFSSEISIIFYFTFKYVILFELILV